MSTLHEISIDASTIRIHSFTTTALVANFLGIPFGRVKKRFCVAAGVALSSLGPSIDATAWGPRCPQSRNYGRERRGHLHEGNPVRSAVIESETECLSRNIFAPKDALSSNTNLSVMVWIHGGGWAFANGGPDYGKTKALVHVNNSNASQMATILYRKPFGWRNLSYSLKSTVGWATTAS